MGLFGAAHRCADERGDHPKICHTYYSMMILTTVIPYIKI